MNLQETIAALEKQAAQYTEAANTLRQLVEQEGGQSAAVKTVAKSAVAAKKSAKKPGAAKKKQGGRKSVVSAETRAKISEALRASHAARKAKSA